MKILLDYLHNPYVQMVAVIVAPFAVLVFVTLVIRFQNFLRGKFPELAPIIDEAARRGLVYAEQVAKSTGAKREEKLNMAVDMAQRFAQERYGVTLARQTVIDAIEFFLGVATAKVVGVIEVGDPNG